MNYSKMAGQFVCKMAMPLALMFAACSTDDGDPASKVAGGSSEEPSIVAYNNISLKGRAYYAPLEENAKPSLDNIDASFSQNVFWAGGTVTLKELDSTTLQWVDGVSYTVEISGAVEDSVTGAMIPSNNGAVQFDSVSLNSPIVMLIAISGDVSLHAILDLRDTNSFVVDAWTHLVAYRMKKLVASGKSFAEAKVQAETEIAAAFGLDDFDASEASLLRNELNEIPFALLEKFNSELGETGPAGGFSTSVKESVKYVLLRSPLIRMSLFPESAFERLGNDAVQFYQESLQKKKVLLHLLASVYGSAACSSENEGAFVDISDVDMKLKCRAGSWELYDNRVDQLNIAPVLGTMTDSRDGRTYKTVTYDFGGTSQIWMAENLNYVTDKSSCYRDSSYCSVYGRLYTIFPLDSTYDKYASEEDCHVDRMEVWMAELRALKDDVTEDDSLMLDESADRVCKELKETPDNPDRLNWSKVIDSLDVLGFNVCPEGWRMPTYEDWETLFSHIDYNLLQSAYGNPTGFGIEVMGKVSGENGRYRASINSGMNILFTPRPTPEYMLGPGKEYVGDAVGMIHTRTKVMNDGYLIFAYTYAMPSMGFVRCIKND